MPRWAAGLALPGHGLLVIRLDRLSVHPSGGLEVVLAHELVHLAMGVLGEEQFAKLPWWFHEGIAQALSGHPLFRREAELRDLAATGRLRYLYRLGREENLNRRATDLAYQQAWSFALFLIDLCGPDVFARIIAAFQRRNDFNLAFLEATGHSFVALEEGWKALLLTRPGATMLLVARQLFWILLVLALPLMGLALVRRFKREKVIEARWKQQELAEAEVRDDVALSGEEDPGPGQDG